MKKIIKKVVIILILIFAIYEFSFLNNIAYANNEMESLEYDSEETAQLDTDIAKELLEYVEKETKKQIIFEVIFVVFSITLLITFLCIAGMKEFSNSIKEMETQEGSEARDKIIEYNESYIKCQRGLIIFGTLAFILVLIQAYTIYTW